MTARSYWFEHALLPLGWAAHVLVTVANGTITSVTTDALQPSDAIRLKGAAIPGMPNLHSHTFQRGMAGLAETRGPSGDSFWTWRQVMYRFLERLTPDDVEAIAAMAMMEMLEGGFTSLAEFHYLHLDQDGLPYANRAELSARIAAAASVTGIGLTLLPVLYAQGGFGGLPAQPGQKRFLNHIDGYLALHEAATKALKPLPHARIGVAPHSLRAVTPETLEALVAAGLPGPIHIHIAEQTKEVDDCLAWSGRRPVQWLFENQCVDERWCLIHATHMEPGEVAMVAKSGAVAGLCPLTEANLGDGFFDALGFQAASGRWGVGSDSNVQIGAAEELRCFEYGQRLRHRGRNMMADKEGASTGAALYSAGLSGGARALGQAVGQIAVGMRADFVVLDLEHPTLAPLPQAHWLDAYVFVAGQSAIERVIAGGETLVLQGRHLARKAIAARFVAAMKRVLQ